MSQVPSQKLKFEGKVLIRQRDDDAAYLFCSRSLGFGDEGANQSSLFRGTHFGERHFDSLSLLEKTDKFNRQIQQTM